MKELQELFDQYIQEGEFIRKLRPASLRGYKYAFDLLIRIVPDISLDTITPSTLIQFFKTLETRDRVVGRDIHKKGIKNSTAATYRSKLNSFFEWLRIKGKIKENPFNGIPYPSVSYEDMKFLKREQLVKIINAVFNNPERDLLAQKRDILMLHILSYCGLRKNELLKLEMRDFDLERKILTVRMETSKSKKTRKLPLHSETIYYYRDFAIEKSRRGYTTPFVVVSSTRDEGLSEQGLKHWVNRLKRLSGVRFHLHQLRHTFAMNYLKQSNNLIKLQQLMGHTDLKMTAKYLRCIPTEEMRADIEKMSFDHFI